MTTTWQRYITFSCEHKEIFLIETQWKVEYNEIFHDVEIIKEAPVKISGAL